MAYKDSGSSKGSDKSGGMGKSCPTPSGYKVSGNKNTGYQNPVKKS